MHARPLAAWSLAAVLASTLGVAGCTGGASAQKSAPSPGSATPSVTGEGVVSAPEAKQALAAYDGAIGPAISAGDRSRIAELQSGGLLSRTVARLRLAAHQHTAPLPPDSVESPVFYAGTRGPHPSWYVARETNSHDPGQTQFTLLQRDGAGPAWRVAFESVAQGHALPEPVLTNGAVTTADSARTAQAQTAVTWVCQYLATAKRPTGLTDVALAQQNTEISENYRKQGSYYERDTATCRVDPAAPMRVITTTDGAVAAFASLQLNATNTARKGWTLRLDPSYDGAFTTWLRHVHRVTYRVSMDVVVRVAPDGSAALVGYTEGLTGISSS